MSLDVCVDGTIAGAVDNLQFASCALLGGGQTTLLIVLGLDGAAIAIEVGLRPHDVFLRVRLALVVMGAVLAHLGLTLALRAAHGRCRAPASLGTESQAHHQCHKQCNQFLHILDVFLGESIELDNN